MLAQPALTQDSHFSWRITLCQPSFHLRYVNFVEIMCPLFSRDALARCLPTFRESVSGYGLDFVWPKLLDYPHQGIAVIDSIPMRHAREIDRDNGAFYVYLRTLGVDPDREFRHLVNKYRVKAKPRMAGGIPSDDYGHFYFI